MVSDGLEQPPCREGGVFVRNSAFTLITRLALIISSLGASILTARILGPEKKGELGIILLAPSILITLGGIAISSANVYFIGSGKPKLNEIFWNSVFVSAAIGTFLVGLFLVAFPVVGQFFQNADRNLLTFAILSVPFQLFYVFGIFIPLGQRRVIAYNLLKTVEPVAFLLALGVLIWWLKLGVRGGVTAYIIGILMGCVVFIAFAIKTIPLDFGLNYELGKRSTAYALKCHLGSVTWFLTRRIAILLVNKLMTPSEVGYYIVALSVSEALWHLPKAISLVLFPEISSKKDRYSRIAITSRVCRNTGFILLLGAIICGLLIGKFIRIIYGQAYLPSIEAIWILLPGSVFLGIHEIIGSYMVGIGKPLINSIITSVMLVSTIVLNILLIPCLGIYGSALATTITYGAGLAIIICVYRKMTSERIGAFLFITRDDFKYYRRMINNKLAGVSHRLRG